MIGKTVSHYKILEEVGRGGMGVIYKAEDIKLKRIDALKFLPAAYTQDLEARERFEREAQAAATLNHPNIVTVYDISEYENQIYIAMEYVDGMTLREKFSDNADRDTREITRQLKRSSTTSGQINEIIDIVIQVCKGLQKAHQAGIVHRDIKPHNILINKEGVVKILDFGVAKLIGASQLTMEFYTVGTPHYMSPEQSQGDEIDQRTDIWALGVVLYEMLTGRLPFKGETPNTVIYSITTKDFTPVTALDSSIPFEMDQIVNRCLEKNINKRFQSVDELIAELECLKSDLDSGKRPGKIRRFFLKYRSAPLKSLRKLAVLAAALVLVLGLLSIFTVPPVNKGVKRFLGFTVVPGKLHIAVLPFTCEGDDPRNQAFSRGLKETVIYKLTRLEQFYSNLWIISTKSLHGYKITGPLEARRIFGATLAVTGDIKRSGNTLDLTLDLIDTKSLDKIKTRTTRNSIQNLSTFQDGIVLQLARMMEMELTAEARQTLSQGGTALPGAYEFYLQGRGYLEYEKDKEKIDLAIDRFNRAIAQAPSYALAHAGLAEARRIKYNLTKDMEWADKAVESCKKAIQINGRIAHIHVTLGIIYKGINRNEEAINQFRQAIQLNPECYYAHLQMAKTYDKVKRLKEAEETYKKIARLRPGYWPGFTYLGYFYVQNARYPEAINMYKKAAEITPHNPEPYLKLGSIHYYMGRYDLAADMLEKSISIKPDAYASSNLGTIYFSRGRYTDAAAMFEEALKLKDNDYILWGHLADAYRCMNGYSKKAVETYKTAINLAGKQLAENPDNAVAVIRSDLALYYARSGHLENALDEISAVQKKGLENLDAIKASVIVFELAGQRDNALKTLKEYVERYGSMEELIKEPDLSELWKDQRCKKLLR